jgi:hypothetical protein
MKLLGHLAVRPLLAFICLFLLLTPGFLGLLEENAFAQSDPALEGVYLPFWQGTQDYGEDGTTYFFTLDVLNLRDKSFKTLNGATLATNLGNVVFKGPIELAKGGGRFLMGQVKSAKDVSNLLIHKATLNLDGKDYDALANIAPVNIVFPINVVTPTYLMCPPGAYDFFVVEGTFEGIEEGDFVHVYIKVNGQMRDFSPSWQVSDFVNNASNVGKRVKAFVEKAKVMDGVEGPTDCLSIEAITKIVLLDSKARPSKK